LDPQKDSIFFLKAILKIKKELVSRQWKVYLFGNGILEHEVMQFIEINSMTDIITRKISSSLYPFFLESKIYVSTQKYENYSSLTILEAMSCGNVIIAKNVGQTSSFITNGINGFLCEENNPGSLSDAVLKAIDLKDDEFQLISHNNKNSIEKNYSLKNFTDLFNKAVEQ
jgi:glycosyltransferase involved in cell wall biosynthesis